MDPITPGDIDKGYFFVPMPPIQYKPLEQIDPASFNTRKGILTKYGRKILEQGQKYYGKLTIDNKMTIQDIMAKSGLKNPGSKIFVLFSAGGLKDQPHLNIEPEYFDWKMKLVLEGMAWLDPKEYIPFLDDAEVGEMIVLKEMIALVRLRYPKDDEDSPVWTIKKDQ